MAYNFSLKKYANGTFQLTYYDFPVLDSFDKELINYVPYDNAIESEYDDTLDYTPWGYSDGAITDFKEADLSVTIENRLTPEELEKRRNHSLSTSLTRTIHKVYDYARNNVWEWFFTFTLSEDNVIDRSDYKECSKVVLKWMNNIRKRYKDLKYLVVPERHPSSGCWHYHALVSGIDIKEFVIAKNNKKYLTDKFGSIIYKNGQPVSNNYFGMDLKTKYPDGNYIYNIKSYRGGFSTATQIISTKRAVSYIIKYLTKDLAECTFGCRRFYPSSNLLLPEREVGLYERTSLAEIVASIESSYNVTLSADFIKSVTINNGAYKNVVSYLEFE